MSRENEGVIWSYIIMYRPVISVSLCLGRETLVTSDLNLNLSVVYNEPFRLKKAYAASLCSLFVASTAA